MRILVLFIFVFVVVSSMANGQPIVPAMIIFGDSVVDVGNNNLNTLIKANFPPYGRNFVTQKPTGRFCNGKPKDFIGSSLIHKRRLNLDWGKLGFCCSGFYDRTAQLYRAISLTQQLKYYKEYQNKIDNMIGEDKANTILGNSFTAGSSDFFQSYCIDLFLNRLYSPARFSNMLLKSYSTFVQTLYELGVRTLGVTGLPPTGCFPAAITVFGGGGDSGNNQCLARLNQDASQNLARNLPGLKILVLDLYNPLFDVITKPSDSGLFESGKACYGTGTVETSVLCSTRSVGTCSNATEYVFWDGFHPLEAANKVLAGDLLEQGLDLIS